MRWLALTCLLFALSVGLFADTRPPAQNPAPKSGVSLNGHTFTLPPGFSIELAVKPGLIDRPITVSMDELGRLYVADSSGSNAKVADQLRDRPHRIVRIEDSDGDGVYDKSTIFADKMMFPEGTLWHAGSLYVAAPPSIWKLTDTDGDGIADVRIEWFEGKTLTGCANDLHGPYLGRDGRIYWCKGAFAQQTYKRPGKPDFVTRASHIFRAREDGSDIEPVMTGGMDNPVGLAITAAGERIFTTTFFQHPAGGQRDGLIHAIPGGIYGKDHSVIYDPAHRWSGPGLMPVLSHMGPAAPAGLAVYDSQVFGKEFEGNLFASQFNLQKVSRHVLLPHGSGFLSRDEDFLVSANRDFHPTDVAEDADGSILVIDTGGWYKLCCPSSQLVKPDVRGAIYRVRRAGSPRVKDPRGLAIVWTKVDTPALISLLNDTRPFVRRRAADTLARKGIPTVPALSDALRASTSARARLQSVWVATRIEHASARAAVRLALKDTSDDVRHAALNSVSLWRDGEAAAQLVGLLDHPSLHTRRLAAECLGRIGHKPAVPALFTALGKPADRGLEHALVYALIEIADRTATAQYLISDDPRFRRAALIAIDQMEAGKLTSAEVARELTATDPALREASWWIAGRHPDWGDAMAGFFRARMREPSMTAEARTELVTQLAGFARTPSIQSLLASRVSDTGSTPEEKTLALRAMATSSVKPVPAGWLPALLGALTADNTDLVGEAIAAVRVLPLQRKNAGKIVERLLSLADDLKQKVEVRLGALAAVPGGPGALTDSRFDLARSRLDREQPVSVRTLAAEVVSRASLTSNQLLGLTRVLDKVGPMELDRVLEAFGRSTNEEVGLKLLATLETSPVRSSLRIDALRTRLGKYSARVLKSAEKLYAELDRDRQSQQAQLEKLLNALPGGDVRRGQAVFNGQKAACAACHAIGYLGGKIGPDLTRIGKVRGKRDLLESILLPSASLVRSYEPITITTVRGKVLNGLVKKESSTEIVLTIGANEEVRIGRGEIEDIQPGKVSIMPAGLDKILTAQELADLVAFLQACQ